MVSLEHTDALFSYSMALTRNTYGAEDLVQETYFVPYGQWDGSGKTVMPRAGCIPSYETLGSTKCVNRGPDRSYSNVASN